MKTKLKWLAMLVVVLTAFVFIPISSAQDDDFISISPVDQKDTSTMMNSDAVDGKAVPDKPAAEPTEPPKAVEAKPAPKTVEPGPAAGKMASIDKILTLDLADRSEIRIITSSKVKYKATELAPPPNTRILVQLTKCGVKGATINVGKGGVEKVRSAPHNSTAWVVIDLQQKLKWKVRDDGEIIVVEIPKGGAALKTGAAPKTYTEEEPASAGAGSGMIYRVIDVAGKNLGKKTRVIVTTDGPVKYRVKKDSGNKQVVLDVLEAVSIWQKGSFTMDGSSVSTVNLREDKAAKTVGINIGLSDNLPYTVTRDQNQIVVEVDNSLASGKLPKKKLDLYQKISLNIQDASLPGVLRLLSTQTGFEFAVSPSVSIARPVTIREEEQTLDQVLRDILIPQGMFYEVNENMIKVGNITEIKTEKQLRKKHASFYYPKTMKAMDLKTLLDVQIAKEPLMDMAVQVDSSQGNNRIMIVGTEEDMDKVMGMISSVDGGGTADTEGYTTGGLKTKVYKLQYIAPSRISDNIKALLSSDGLVQIDDRSGNIIVTDNGGYLKKVEAVIRKLDVKLRQVLIEAKLYEVDVGAIKNLGIKWNSTGQNNNPHIVGDVNTGMAPGTGIGQLVVGMMQNGLNISATLEALESNNKAMLLSSPKIAVGDNQSAKIDTTRSTYYTQTTIQDQPNSAPVVSTTYIKVDLPIALIVGAKITDDNKIIMNVNVTVTKILGVATGSAPPDTTTQSAITQIMASNNDTAVIGGLITENNSMQEDKVPFLGDLPLIGNLFKGTKEQKQKVELVVFLTPVIVEE
jgi:type IV pilus assembly protein PilQ